VFRAVSAFPGPFTLEGAEAVAGAGAGQAVLRLVDCSLLTPPRADPDGRSRYLMLETLQAYGAGLLAEAGEDGQVAAALAGYAAEVAEEANAGLYSSTWEAAGLRHLDAEEVTLRHALAWAMDHDRALALRLALAQEQWWQIRGRLTSQAPLLAAAAEHAAVGSDEWCAAHMCLGQAAGQLADSAAALEHFSMVRDAVEDPQRPASEAGPIILSICLCGRSSALLAMGRVDEAADDARRALDQGREAGYPGLEAMALVGLSGAVWRGGDRDGALRLARQAQQVPGEIAGALRRALGLIVTAILTEAGDLAAAEQVCAAGLASCRDVGDLTNLSAQLYNRAILDLRTGRVGDATAHLREQLQIAMQAGQRPVLLAGLDCCGHLCAATQRPAGAVTVWAAMFALAGTRRLPHESGNLGDREEILAEARRRLGPAAAQAARERGAAMSLATATEYALLLAAEEPPGTDDAAEDRSAADGAGPVTGLLKLSPRERELVTLVAQGRTDAQIATQLYITVRTVSSHLDRIRDKTGCRRRADLTRLALSVGLV
jgi:DNA-binding CsgD family transcriptional regulator/tetratricopeptide (TPR) repeat protein